ncbi:hypothetical protein [Clostridium ganghwense]|uniref:Uncharacterized protein n=1 Tax=Clostridium ganghwense TaxID=312089 RepID=A0ABT4CJZ5_9CLOT|nr:hypothetical protein [Clostridium ganghwense]MCY6369369.1 hypothetical protein [Clostridium ganghwense]
MKFTYELLGVGWAEVNIEINGQKSYSSPSYLSDALGDLLNALLRIIPELDYYEGAPDNKEFVVWSEEPAETQWTLELVDLDKIRIKIECFEDEDNDNGTIDIDEICNLNQFLSEVVKALDLLLEKHGFIGYKEMWYEYEFPIGAYLNLKYYLDNKSSFPMQEKIQDGEKYRKSLIKEELMILKKLSSKL